MPCLTGIIFFWVRFRRWNVNKSIRARSWGLQLPLPTIKRLFMLPWRAIPVTLAHWRELQIIILLHSASFCHSSSSSLCCFSSPWTLAWSPPFHSFCSSTFFSTQTCGHTAVLCFDTPAPLQSSDTKLLFGEGRMTKSIEFFFLRKMVNTQDLDHE